MRPIAIASAVLVALQVACSGAHIVAVTAETDETVNGFRYYESSPYILVYADGKGGIVSKLLYLPDQRKLRSIEPWEFLAKNTTNLKFSNGVLTEATLEGDGTALPKAMVEALKTVAAAAAGGIGFRKIEGDEKTLSVPVPQLFRVIFKDGVASLEPAESELKFVKVRTGISGGN